MSAVNPFEALPGAAPVSAAPDVEANPFASLPDAPGPTLAKAANEGDPFASLPITQKPQMPTPQPQARSATEAPDSTAPWWQRAAAADARIGGELYGALGRGTNRAAFDIIQPVTDAAQYAAKSVTAPLDFARKAVGLSGPNQINKALTNVQAANADIEKANAVPAGTPLAVSVVGSLPEMASMIGQAALTGGASDIADTAEGGGMLARLLANAPEGMRSMIPSALEQADATAHQALNAGKTPSQASAAAAASFTSTLLMGAMPGASKLERVASGAVGVPALGEAQNAATSAALGEPYKPAPASDITNALLGAGLGVLGHGAPDAQTPREQPETEQVESRQTETAETSNPFMSLPQGQILTPPRAMGDVQHLPGKKEPALPSLAEATQGAENVPQTAAIGAENVSPTAAINAPAVPAIPALQQSLADVDQRIQAATGNTRDQLLKQRAALQLAASLEPTSADIQAPTPTPPESQGPQEAPAQATPAANQAAPIRPPDEIKQEASTTAGSSEQASGTRPIEPVTKKMVRRGIPPVDPRTDDMLAAIAKMGGVSKAGAEAEGIDPADTRATFGYRIHRVFTKNGKSMDEMAELLAQHGYPVLDAEGRYDPNVLLERLDDALGGKKVYSNAFDYNRLSQPEERATEPEPVPEASEAGTGADLTPESYDDDETPHDRVMQDLTDRALAVNYDAAQPLVEDWALGKISDDDAADKLQAIINARTIHDETAKREQATSPTADEAENRRTSVQLRENAPVAEAQGDRQANQGLELTQEVAPHEAPKRPVAVQGDMLGGASDTAQALHRAELAKDEAHNSGQQSAETGNPNDLFSAARQQRDIEDEPPTPVSASEQWDGMGTLQRHTLAIESGLGKSAARAAATSDFDLLNKTNQSLVSRKLAQLRAKVSGAQGDHTLKHEETPKGVRLYSLKNQRPISARGLLGAAYDLIGRHADAFVSPKTDARTMDGVFRDHKFKKDLLPEPDTNDMKVRMKEADKAWTVHVTKFRDVHIYQKGRAVWTNIALLQQGEQGSQIYSAIADYAKNNDLTFIGDPEGLSDIAGKRRTEMMNSSALKLGTTEHLSPHPNQRLADAATGRAALEWNVGHEGENQDALRVTTMENTFAEHPELRKMHYNVSKGSFENPDGTELTDEQISKIVRPEARGSQDQVSEGDRGTTDLLNKVRELENRRGGRSGASGDGEDGEHLWILFPGESETSRRDSPAGGRVVPGRREQLAPEQRPEMARGRRGVLDEHGVQRSQDLLTVGLRTAKRAILTHTLLDAEDRSNPLEQRQIIEHLSADELPKALRKLWYSHASKNKSVGLPTEAVESRIAPVRERAGVPRIVVDEGESAFPADAQDEIKSLGHSGNVEGYYDPATDTVHLNASNLDGVDDVDRVLAHELFHARLHSLSDTETSRVTGHVGLRDVFGPGIDPILTRVALSYGKSGLQDILDEYHLDWSNPQDRRIAAEEKLAHIAQTGEKPTLVQHLVNFVRGWLRRLVPSLKLSDSEVLGMVNEIRGGSGRAGPEGKHALYSLGNPEDAKDIDDAHDAIKGGQADVAIESLKSKGIPTETLGTHVLKDVQPELPDIPSASAGRPVPHRTDEYYEQLAAKGHAGFRERTRDSLNGLTQKWHAFVAQLKTDEQKVAAAAVRREMTRYELLESNRNVKIAELRGFFAKLGVGGTGVWIGRYEEGDRSMPHAAEVERILADQLDVEHRSGVDVGELKNYLPHYYYKGAEFQKWLVNWQAEKFGGKSGFQKRRVFPTLAEAMEAGFKPRFSNLADALFLRVHQGMHQARRARTLQNLLRLGMIRVSSRAEQLRPGETLYETKDLGAYAVPEQIAPILGNGIDPKDLWTDQSLPATVFRAWMNFKVPVISAQLGFSLFHLTHEILGLRAGSGVGERVNAFLNTGATEDSVGKLARDLLLQVSSVGNTTPFSLARIRVALRGGWANLSSGEKLRMRSIGFTEGNSRRLTEEEATLARLIVEGGLPTTNPLEYRGSVVKNMEHALQDKDVIGAGLRAPLVALRAIQVPIMDWLVPNLKIAAFVDGARTLLQTHPDLLDNEPKRLRLLGDLTENIEKRFGQMSYDRLFWSKPFKGILQGTFLSFAWNYGFVHQFGGGLKDLVLAPYHTFGRIALDRDDKIITSRAVYALTYLTLASLSSSLLQWALTGKHPTSMEDLAYPQIGGVNADGTPKRVTTPFFTRELGAMYYHSRDEGVVHGIGEMVFDKLSPVLNILGDQWNNKNFYGQELSNPNDTLPEQTVERIKALGVSLLPLSTQPLARPGNTGKDFALALAGFNPAPGYVRQSAMVAQIWQNFDRYNATTKTSLQVEQSNVRKALITLYQSGDTQDFQQKLTDAVQTYHWSRAQVMGIYKEMNEPPAAYAYQQLPRMIKVRLFEKMSPEDQERYAPYLGRRAIADAPPEDQKKIEDALQSLREHPPQAAANP